MAPESKPTSLPDSDLTDATRSAITLLCEKVGGATEILPQKLSTAAEADVRQFCSKITISATQATQDVQAIVTGQWQLVSNATKVELANIAIQVANANAGSVSSGGSPPTIDPASLTRGKGVQKKLSVPVNFCSHTNVKLLVNYDKDKLMRGTLNINGVGAELTYDFKSRAMKGSVTGSAFLDTTTVKPNGAGFIGVRLELP